MTLTSEQQGSCKNCKFLSSTSKHWPSRRFWGTKSLWATSPFHLSQGSGGCLKSARRDSSSSCFYLLLVSLQKPDQPRVKLPEFPLTPTWVNMPRSWTAVCRSLKQIHLIQFGANSFQFYRQVNSNMIFRDADWGHRGFGDKSNALGSDWQGFKFCLFSVMLSRFLNTVT